MRHTTDVRAPAICELQPWQPDRTADIYPFCGVEMLQQLEEIVPVNKRVRVYENEPFLPWRKPVAVLLLHCPDLALHS